MFLRLGIFRHILNHISKQLPGSDFHPATQPHSLNPTVSQAAKAPANLCSYSGPPGTKRATVLRAPHAAACAGSMAHTTSINSAEPQ